MRMRMMKMRDEEEGDEDDRMVQRDDVLNGTQKGWKECVRMKKYRS